MPEAIEFNLSEEDIDEYLTLVGFAISKGTANVSASDMKKLKPLMRYYAKKKHPFTACVRDNRKRFGSLTEKYCAVLKDLIVGSTKWRGKGKKYTPANLSEDTIDDFMREIELEIPAGFSDYLSALSEEDIELMTRDSIAQNLDLASSSSVWNEDESYNNVRRSIQESLDQDFSEHGGVEGEGDAVYGSEYWVEDVSDGKALVCYKGEDYWIVPFSVADGHAELADQDKWTPVEKAWVKANLSDEKKILAEMFFDDNSTELAEEEDGIWKTILREGTWARSPVPGMFEKPITVTKSGRSDAKSLIISMEELKENFENGIKQHVTIPTSHADKVLENTGFVKSLRFSKDNKGRDVLQALHHFTEPEVKEKAKRGTIANTSAGVLFDYVHKESGKKYGAVLGHVALTNSPWLNEMDHFGLNASEKLDVIAFSEEHEVDTSKNSLGGEIVSTATVDDSKETEEVATPAVSTFFDEIGLSEDEVRASLDRLKKVEEENKQNRIDAKCKSWQEEGKSPALVKEARTILMSDSGAVALNLSEDGATKNLTLSDVVERLIAAAPTVNLTDDVINDSDLVGRRPDQDTSLENEKANLSHDEKVLAFSLMFDEQMDEERAIAEAKRRFASSVATE